MVSLRRRVTLRRQWLGQRLRDLREDNDLTLAEVAEFLMRDASQVSRFENGKYPVPDQELPRLLEFLGVCEEHQRDELLKFNDEAWRTDWWDGYADDVAGTLIDYVWLESRATRIRTFDVTSIYGTVQTSDYARALIQRANTDATAQMTERWVELRMMRQVVLSRAEPVRLEMILDEAALRRTVGGAQVQAAQLRYLISQLERSNIELRVLPFGSGAHASPDGSFRLVDSPEPFPELACVESPAGMLYLEPPKTERFTAMYDQLHEHALSSDASIALIELVAKELE